MDKRILVVDFGSDAGPLQRALSEQGLDPVRVRDEAEMVEQWGVPDAVLVAIDAAEDRYRDLVRTIRRSEHGQVPILFYGSGQSEAPIRAPSEALAHGGDYFFRLPCDLSYLAGRARAWAERGARRDPQDLPDPAPTEAPELEGFEAARGTVRVPSLDRLRSAEAPSLDNPPPDWSWVQELDRSELRGAIEMDLEDPFSETTHFGLGDEVFPPEPVPESRGLPGVGGDEQAALLAGSEIDPLDELNIEEVEEIEAPASPMARIDVVPERPAPESGPLWMAEQAPTTEVPTLSTSPTPSVERSLPLTSPRIPVLEKAEVPAPAANGAIAPAANGTVAPAANGAIAPAANGAIAPAAPARGPTQVEFPRVEAPERVVTGLRPAERTRISDQTLEALRALLEGQDPPTPEEEAPAALELDAPEPPQTWTDGPDDEENPFEVNEPTLTLQPEERQVWTASLLAESCEQFPMAVASSPPGSPIDDEEDTQELLLAPIAAAAEDDDFPPGALAIVHQAERQQRRGAVAEACSGFALAAQIYIDHAMPEPARSLYRQILKIDPAHPFAEDRLQSLDRAPSGGKPSDEYVLEFTDDPVERPDMASDLELGPVDPNPDHILRTDPIYPRVEVEASEPSLPETAPLWPPEPSLGHLRGSGLTPSSGQAAGISDLVQVFLRARAQRSTGTLRLGGPPSLLLAHGVPSGLEGDTVLPSFLRLVADLGRIGEGQARELARAAWRSPRAVARKLAHRGLIDPEEEILLPSRHLEDHLVRALQHRGEWSFVPSEDVRTEDLVPRVDDLREWLVELLPRAASVSELREALSLGPETVSIVAGTDHFVGPSDLPLVNLLDGHRGLEEAARLAGLPISRAYSWALVWLKEGLAERRVRLPAPVEPPAAPREIATTSPSVRDLPALKPRATTRPGFRIERRSFQTSGRFTLGGDLQLSETAASASAADRPSSDSGHTPEDVQLALDRDARLASLDEKARLKALAEVVRTQDYFGILDVDATASKKAIDDAHRRLRDLVPEDVEGELEAMVREVLRSVDEARDVLMIPELRAAYEHHLEPRP